MIVEGEKKSLEKDKELMCTADRELLLACIYFDQSHAGYLLDKDIEDIIHTTGLQLSRAQVSVCYIAYMSVQLVTVSMSLVAVLTHMFSRQHTCTQLHRRHNTAEHCQWHKC